jgi:hypothetical protein
LSFYSNNRLWGGGGGHGEAATAVLFHARHNGGARRFQAGTTDTTRVAMMERYIDNDQCRWRSILSYFGQRADKPCGHCDNCARRAGRSMSRSATRAPFPVESHVKHDSWGPGRILGYDGDTVTVLFDEGGYRTFSLDLVVARDLLRPLPNQVG